MSSKHGWIIPTVAATLLLVSPVADAQRRRTSSKRPARATVRRSGAETGLIGIKLFDTGIRVVQVYGNPDSITAVSAGAGASPGGGPGGFGGGRPGGFGGGAPGARGGGGASGAAPALEGTSPIPPDPMDGLIGGNFQRGGASAPGVGEGGAGGPGGPGPGGFGPGGRGPGGPGGAPGGAGGGTTETADYTRWIYTKNGAKFGFVLDKFNRVIQIEAIGLQNGRVKTSRGISFGSTFSQVIKAYAPSAAPDGYDINGDTVTVKFLTRQRVAFRLSKLGSKQPHVVTGIVVAAGKA